MVLSVGSLVGGGTGDAPVRTEVAAGSQRVSAQAMGSPTAVRELLSETTSTLVAATGSTTSTTAPTSTTGAPTTSPTGAPTTTAAEADADDAGSTTTQAPATPAAPTTTTTHTHRSTTTAAPATTAAPTTAPPTTAAPTTTAPPQPASGSSSEGYAYDDPRSTQVWYDLAQCESGGNWSINTGNGYYGGLQFSLATWESVGGTGYPHEHPAATQIDMGRRLQARQGWGAWPHCSEELGLR